MFKYSIETTSGMFCVGMWLMMMSLEKTRRWMMTPSDIVRHTCVVQYQGRTEERKDGWKGGACVTDVLKRTVVVESKLVGR